MDGRMDTPLEVLLVLPGVLVQIQLTVNVCGTHTSVSHVRAQRTWFHFTLIAEVVVQNKMEPECFCVCNTWWGSLFWWEKWWHIMLFFFFHLIFFFWIGGGLQGSSLFFSGDDVYVLAHPCSKCLQTWTLWLYSRFLSCHSRWFGLPGRSASWSSLSESWGSCFCFEGGGLIFGRGGTGREFICLKIKYVTQLRFECACYSGLKLWNSTELS